MKVVVLGGGIAGLCMGIYLHQHNFEVCINEGQILSAVRVHAFLMHDDGVSILKELTHKTSSDLPGKTLNTLVLKNAAAELLGEDPLQNWQCFKPADLLKWLTDQLPVEIQNNNRVFTNFVYQNDRIVAAEFSNGEREYGDLFIGADGAGSIVRKEVFGEINFESGRIKEVAGIVQHPELAYALEGRFTKIHHYDKGVVFGIIPVSATELAWYIQYNPLTADAAENNRPELLKELCENLLEGFPAEAAVILTANDFNTSCSSNTKDFDLLPTFHHQNVVLIGDAAHVSLPFTCSSTTNALLDAKVLTTCLVDYPDYAAAFKAYYKNRAASISAHIYLGRKLQNSFLNPSV